MGVEVVRVEERRRRGKRVERRGVVPNEGIRMEEERIGD